MANILSRAMEGHTDMTYNEASSVPTVLGVASRLGTYMSARMQADPPKDEADDV